MELTGYQNPEIYDGNGNLIRSGAFGPNTPLTDPHGRGLYDYLVNNIENLKDGVGGAAMSASTATTQAALATAKAAEALQVVEDITAAKDAALDAKEAAMQAKTDAETAAAQAAAITTPDGLAGRVLALEGAPHYGYDQEGHLCFYYGREVG